MQTIGIVSPGELGAALGGEFRRAGLQVVTTTAGRSAASAARCRAFELETVDALAEVVGRADVLISCVPPAAALPVAREIAATRGAAVRPVLYIDLNSIAPRTVLQVEETVRRQDLTFVDATIHGTSQHLRDLAVFYASGPGATPAVELFAAIMRTENLGAIPGRAAAFKMLLGGISKSLVAMMLEVGCAAERQEVLPAFLQACEIFYPGVMRALDRTMLSYPQHAARRGDEVTQIESLFRDLGIEPAVVGATRQVLARLAASRVCRPEPYPARSLADLLGQAHAAAVCDAAGSKGTRDLEA